jgi:hypothetical protein
VSSSYHEQVARAGGITARGAFPGTAADYEKMDRRIKQPLMTIPRDYAVYRDDYSPYLRMWVNVLGFTLDPENHGYGVFPP